MSKIKISITLLNFRLAALEGVIDFRLLSDEKSNFLLCFISFEDSGSVYLYQMYNWSRAMHVPNFVIIASTVAMVTRV